MKKIGRNDRCPCGSGKKFKKCHMGREDELPLEALGEMSIKEIGANITGLPLVEYGRSREMNEALNINELTGKDVGIKFVDLTKYMDLNLFGGPHTVTSKGKSGGVFVNLYKTVETDPDNVYLAISRDIDDSTLIHELAHVLDYFGGSKLMPGTLQPLSFESEVPVDHLEHPKEFGYWLTYLKEKFDVQQDADDAIISFSAVFFAAITL